MAAPETNTIVLNDPQLTCRASLLQHCREPSHIRNDSRCILRSKAKYDDTRVLIRRVRLNIREVQIEREENSAFGPRPPGNDRILRIRTKPSSRTVSTSRPCSRSVTATSRGRFS